MNKTDKRKHMPRRFECPSCGEASMIAHRDGWRISLLYVCPDCKTKFETVPSEPQRA